ncbi:heterokaryon incompatibility protein-domain-containing protein [Xylariaceae sp. FL1272]|nr:heterokaryon incompatibility protein-domain-containing protein [Xylariaceae sp. FL1272]
MQADRPAVLLCTSCIILDQLGPKEPVPIEPPGTGNAAQDKQTISFSIRHLRNRKRSIRLIDIEAGAGPASLHLRLRHAVLKKAPGQPFEALSYVWGSIEEPIGVCIEILYPDSTTSVVEMGLGENLLTALQNLRYADRRRTIWADAICINQQDLTERAKQVLLMGDICGEESHRISWA